MNNHDKNLLSCIISYTLANFAISELEDVCERVLKHVDAADEDGNFRSSCESEIHDIIKSRVEQKYGLFRYPLSVDETMWALNHGCNVNGLHESEDPNFYSSSDGQVWDAERILGCKDPFLVYYIPKYIKFTPKKHEFGEGGWEPFDSVIAVTALVTQLTGVIRNSESKVQYALHSDGTIRNSGGKVLNQWVMSNNVWEILKTKKWVGSQLRESFLKSRQK